MQAVFVKNDILALTSEGCVTRRPNIAIWAILLAGTKTANNASQIWADYDKRVM